MDFIKKHKVIFSFVAGVLLGSLLIYGGFWWFTPELSIDQNSIHTFDDCSLAGFTTYQSADNELTCVLPNGKHFIHWLA
jgi:hypothetical protein